MKKFFVLFLFIIGVSTASYSQSAGKGSGEKSGSKVKSRKQMQHFDKQKKDPNMKHNGTSYKNGRRKHKVDGDGFAPATQEKRGRRKKTGVK